MHPCGIELSHMGVPHGTRVSCIGRGVGNKISYIAYKTSYIAYKRGVRNKISYIAYKISYILYEISYRPTYIT